MRQDLPPVPAGALDRASLRQWLAASPPLVEGLSDPETQLQPNGIDLTLQSVAWFSSLGQLGVDNHDRILAATIEMDFDVEGWVHLAAGPYLITLNEVFHIPLSLIALTWPRSSLLRCGVAIHTGVGDAGYHGRLQCLLSVLNPHGLRLQRGARVVQAVFCPLAQPVAGGYQGQYQRENI